MLQSPNLRLLYFRHRGLDTSSLKVHLAETVAFHPGEGHGCHERGRQVVSLYTFPLLPPPKDLSLVLTGLMRAPFESLATCCLEHLWWKVTFLMSHFGQEGLGIEGPHFRAPLHDFF